jgi:hypothetical protein
MTDDQSAQEPGKPAPQGRNNGRSQASARRTSKSQVRSGLAQRRNPVLVVLEEVLARARRLIFGDKLALAWRLPRSRLR